MAFYNIYSRCYLGTFFTFAVIEALVCSGITYGWASMVVVFKLEHFYLRLCRPFFMEHNLTFPDDISDINWNDTLNVGATYHYKDVEALPGCPRQDSILNLIFTISVFCLSGVKFPSGVFVDKCGPRFARTAGGLMYVAAALGLGFVTIGYEDLLFPIFVFICMGGSLLVISIYQVCNVIYRDTKSQVICILHGAFDSSAVILLIFKELFENGVGMQYISMGYSAFCILLILVGTFVLIPPKNTLFDWIKEEREMGLENLQQSIAGPDFAVRNPRPQRAFSTTSAKSFYESIVSSLVSGEVSNEKSTYSCDGDDSESAFHVHVANNEASDTTECTRRIRKDERAALLSSPISAQRSGGFPKGSVFRSVFSSLYLFELVFLATFQLKLWSFVGSLPDNLERLSNHNKDIVSDYVSIFGYIQFGGILVTPMIGVVFDREHIFGRCESKSAITAEEKRLKKLKQCIAPFAITIMLCVIFSVLALFEDIRFQIPQYVLYTTVRGFVYASHGSYMAVAFPANQFGTLYGLGIFSAGCVGLFEYALFELTNGPFKGDPFFTNMILLILVMFANIHMVNLWRYCRKEERRLNENSLS